jgi:polyphosphate kinase 2 (PPK2 family)
MSQRLPAACVTKHIWTERLIDISHFEQYLTQQGTVILKFFLHVSREEQKKRFLDRLDKPQKHWKFSAADVRERRYWPNYMHAYEEAIRATASRHAPWLVVPADNKWFTRLVVAAAVVRAVDEMRLSYPRVSPQTVRELRTARALLERER